MRTVAILVAILATAALSGCLGVGIGSRVCAQHQPGCDFTDHVMRVWPSGTFCPTWNVQFAFYQPDGQKTDTYAITSGPDQDRIVATLREASQNNTPVHVWYAGQDKVLYLKCKADYPLVIYEASIEEP